MSGDGTGRDDRSKRNWQRTVWRLIDVLSDRAQDDQELRSALLDFSATIESFLGSSQSGTTDGAVEADAERIERAPVARTLSIGGAEADLMVRDGGSPLEEFAVPGVASSEPAVRPGEVHHVPSIGGRHVWPRSIDLVLVQRRAQLKSEACAWAIERRRRIARNADFQDDIRPTDHALGNRARQLENCYLWMLDAYGPSIDDGVLEVIRHCYENVAFAAELSHRFVNDASTGEIDEELLQHLATVQSALRSALSESGLRPDADQEDVFYWLREQSQTHGVYISRHMKVSDPADHDNWLVHRERLEGWLEHQEADEARSRTRRRLLNRLDYHIGPIKNGTSRNVPHDWGVILEVAGEWVDTGFPASDPEITRTIAQLEVNDIPDALEANSSAQQVLNAVDAYIALQERSTQPPPVRDTLSEEATQVADLLRGKVVVLVGGDARPHAKAALERAFDLAELRWVSTHSGKPLGPIETEIRRDDVAAVLLAIRWSSHVYGELNDVCAQADKPFIRLKAGYGPNRVARAIMLQADKRLGES